MSSGESGRIETIAPAVRRMGKVSRILDDGAKWIWPRGFSPRFGFTDATQGAFEQLLTDVEGRRHQPHQGKSGRRRTSSTGRFLMFRFFQLGAQGSPRV